MTDLFKHKPSEMNERRFVAVFGDVYEHSEWIARTTYEAGITEHHNSISHLYETMSNVLAAASDSEKLALINAHPDLAGKAAIAGELTDASTDEQASAGIHHCTESEFTRFSQLNAQYKAKFKFPFIMAVKGSDKHKILTEFTRRIENTHRQEFDQALTEINKIARLRLSCL